MSKRISDCTMKGVNDSLTPSNLSNEGVRVLRTPISINMFLIRVSKTVTLYSRKV